MSTRSRRANAGNRLSMLLAEQTPLDDEDAELFAERDDDEDFDLEAEEERQRQRAAADATSDNEQGSQDGNGEGSGEDDDSEDDDGSESEHDDSNFSDSTDDSDIENDAEPADAGEKELAKQQRMQLRERRLAERNKMFTIKRRAPKPADGSGAGSGSGSEHKKRRVFTSADVLLEGRHSSRKSALRNKQHLIEQMRELEERRARYVPPKRTKQPKLTQEQRLEEAKKTEARNLASLNKFVELEEERKLQQRLAMISRRPKLTQFVRFHSTQYLAEPQLIEVITEKTEDDGMPVKAETPTARDGQNALDSGPPGAAEPQQARQNTQMMDKNSWGSPSAVARPAEDGSESKAVDSISEPSANDPGTHEPSTNDPSSNEPSTNEPSANEPSVNEPSISEPSTNEPSTNEPSTNEPSTNDFSAHESSVNEPSANEPSVNEPSISEPSTNEPSTNEPSTNEPSTNEPSTNEPGANEPSTNEPSTNEPSTNKSSTNDPRNSEPEIKLESEDATPEHAVKPEDSASRETLGAELVPPSANRDGSGGDSAPSQNADIESYTVEPVKLEISGSGVKLEHDDEAQRRVQGPAQLKTYDFLTLHEFSDVSLNKFAARNIILGRIASKPAHMPLKRMCPFSGLPARYLDPSTGVAYYGLESNRLLKLAAENKLCWSKELGGVFLGTGGEQRHAKGVPEGFA